MQNSKPPRSVPKRRDSSLSHAYAVIMAGGSGTRFWPLSRRKRPKQLLELFGRDTLLEQTAARIRSLIPPERTYVFTSELVRDEVARRLPGIPSQQIVAEPAARNTAPCIGLAAHEILRRDPEGILIVLPSDHVIRKPDAFRRALTVIRHFETCQPKMARALAKIASTGGVGSPDTLRRLYPRLEKISIDYALMEKIPDVFTVAVDMGWSDVGSWSVAYELNPKDRNGNVRAARSLCVDSHGNTIGSPDKFVVAVGVGDLAILETGVARLVFGRGRSQEEDI